MYPCATGEFFMKKSKENTRYHVAQQDGLHNCWSECREEGSKLRVAVRCKPPALSDDLRQSGSDFFLRALCRDEVHALLARQTLLELFRDRSKPDGVERPLPAQHCHHGVVVAGARLNDTYLKNLGHMSEIRRKNLTQLLHLRDCAVLRWQCQPKFSQRERRSCQRRACRS